MISRNLGLVVGVGALLLTVSACGSDPPPVAPLPPKPVAVVAPPPAPLPPAPKLRLPATVRPQAYDVFIHLSPKEEQISGRSDITLAITEPTSVIWVHAGDNLSVHLATVDDKPARVQRVNEDLIAVAVDAPLAVGNHITRISYMGKLPSRDGRGAYRQEERGEQYIFTQFESTDARRAFPCLDEPGFKAPFTLKLEVPEDQLAFANTPELETKKVMPGWKTVFFAPSKPLPSYLVAFAVGPFEIVDGGKAGMKDTPVRIIVPKGRSADAKFAAANTGKILAQLEKYFDMPYPFEKLDHIAVPQKGGAMENPGLITYGNPTILGKGDERSIRLERTYIAIAAHELGHLWFGDLVTMGWWDDTWLNEAFATWISTKMVEQLHPEWEPVVSRVEATNGVMLNDALVSARKIRQPIESKHDIVTAFDGITYKKGGAVIDMMESWVGDEPFRKAVHGYLTKHAYGNATSQEFLNDVGAQLDAAHKDAFAPAFSSFLDQPGTPFVRAALNCSGGPHLILSQQRYVPIGSEKDGKDQHWQIPFCASYPGGKTCTLLKSTDGKEPDLKLEGATCPAWVNPNADATGYYRSYIDGGFESKLIMNKALKVHERISVLGDVMADVRNGTYDEGTLLGYSPAIVQEGNPHLVGMMASYAGGLNQHLITDATRPKYVAFMKKTFVPAAQKLGWTPKPKEDDATRILRPTLLGVAARFDDKLAAEAQKLTLAWLADRKAIESDLVPAVLDAGARNADKAYWDKLHEAALKTEDRIERTRIIEAMGHAQDPALAKANLDLSLSTQLDPRESISFVLRVAAEPKHRELAWAFVKANYDKLIAPLPWRSGAALANVAGHFCDAEHRADAEAFLKDKKERSEGGPRVIAQLLEEMSLCIAERPKRERSVSDFLAK